MEVVDTFDSDYTRSDSALFEIVFCAVLVPDDSGRLRLLILKFDTQLRCDLLQQLISKLVKLFISQHC